MTGIWRFLTTTILVLLVASCAHSEPFVWANRFPSRTANDTLIQVGDVVRVTVLRQEQLSVTTRVRPDGRIPLALISDVEVAGTTPAGAAARIQAMLEGFVVSPQVMVGVEERAPTHVAVLGHVTKPGMFDLDASQGVLHALAMAGGMTDLADEEKIYVLRTDQVKTIRVRFSMAMLRRGEGSAPRFSFQPGDVLVVDE